MAKIAGRTGGVKGFTIDGVPYEVEGSVTWQRARFKRTTSEGLTGPTGHKRENSTPYLELTIPYKLGVDLADLEAISNSTVQVDLYNGAILLVRAGYQVGDLEPDGDEGNVTLRIETVEEIQEL